MTNDLRIVPRVATDEMRKAIENEVVVDDEFEVCNSWWVYEKTLTAAPDYSHLVIVERKRLEGLERKLEDLKILADNIPELNMNNYNEDDVAELNQSMIEIWSYLNDK